MKIIYTLIVIMTLLISGCSDYKYPDGRDTIESFCKGRFQVLNIASEKVFYDVENQETILDSKISWKVNHGKVFFVGFQKSAKQYIVLNVTNCELIRYDNQDSIPKEYKVIFIN